MTSLGFIVGALLGGALISAIFSGIIERFAFRDQEPDRRATSTVGLAWVLIAILAGFGFADDDGFAWLAGLYYLPGAALVWIWYRKRFREMWTTDDEPDAS